MHQLSYDVVQKRDTGTPRTVARMHCADCSAKAEYTISGPHNPEHVIKWFRQHGWQADKYAPRLNRCPACLAADRGTKHDPDAELKKLALGKVREHMAKASIIPMTGAMTMTNGHSPDDPVDIVPAPTLRPTKDQLAKIRSVLDMQYDDSRGYYLNSYTDAKVAEECAVPRAMVTTVRENAYGPLLGSPETEELRTEIAAIQKQITEAHKIAGEAQTRIDKLLVRVTDLEMKAGMR